MPAAQPRAVWSTWWLALPLLMATCIAPFAFSNLTPDTARDLEAARAILSGHFPTRGPIINSALYLGPIWYYLLAIGLAATGSITGTSLFVGLLATAKYPLAWCTGRELVDARFACFTALAVALPGPAMLQPLTWTHPALVETASWFFLFACCRSWRRGSDAWLVVAALALALAIHAHPTTLLLAPILVVVVAARARDGRPPRPAILAAAMLAFVLPFLPTVIEPSSRAGEVALITSDIAGAWPQWRWSDPGRIAWNMFVAAPSLAAGTFLYRSGTAGPLWYVVLAAIWAIVAAGAFALSAHRRLAAIALVSAAAFVVGLAIIAGLRSFTPYYMTFVLLPAVALAAGAALTALSGHGPPGRATTMVAMSLMVVAQLAMAGGEMVRGSESWVRTALVNFRDFKHAPTRIQEEPLYPAWTRDAVARALCADPGRRPVALHAMLATEFDVGFGLETALACGSRERAVLAGSDPASEHWLGMPSHAWRKLELDPQRRLGSYGIGRPAAIIAPATAHAIASADRYPPRHFPPATPKTLALAFRAPANAALVVTDIVPWYMALSSLTVTRDGAVVPATIASPSLNAFRCRDCGAREVDWTLHLQALDPSWVDVVLLQ